MNALTKPMVVTLLLCCFPLHYSCISDDMQTIEELNAETVVSYNIIENNIISLINDYRISLNLPPLKKLNLISKEAEIHNEHMISENEICHHFFGIREHNLRVNIDAIMVSENVGYGYHTAKGVVDAWLESESHKKNIEGDYNAVGISATMNKKGDYYYTNIFIKR